MHKLKCQYGHTWESPLVTHPYCQKCKTGRGITILRPCLICQAMFETNSIYTALCSDTCRAASQRKHDADAAAKGLPTSL